MSVLALGIFEDSKTQKDVKELIVKEFQANPEEVNKYQYIIAYVDTGSYEGTGWILMRDKKTGKLFENCSSHCSCYGNEMQFEPEITTIEYLKSDKFSCYCYENEDVKIKEKINRLK